MGLEQEDTKGKDKKLEQINEILSDTLSLVILLENDMEIQKTDGIYARVLRMIHEHIKSIQKNLSAYMR